MNRQKQIELSRKRNADLEQKLKDVKFKLEYDRELNQKALSQAKNLITELEMHEIEKQKELNNLKEMRERYQGLLNSLQDMRNEMAKMGFKRPWYKRLIGRTIKKK